MMGRKEDSINKLEFIDLNDFVPSNHILRQIKEKIDFTFIYEHLAKIDVEDSKIVQCFKKFLIIL